MPQLTLARFRTLCRKRAGFFDGRGPLAVVRVPGRLDVMGGIADYSGSVVLEGTIERGVFLALQRRRDDRLRFYSHGLEREGLSPQVEWRLSDFRRAGKPISYAQARRHCARDAQAAWAGYLAGCFLVLERERAAPAFPTGANLFLASDIPMGAGVASSAAIEVAAMYALDQAFSLGLEGLELARLCQIVENRVVGAPCGIMDQVTCALGEPGKLLALRCRPHDVLGLHQIPAGYEVLGLNSNIKHAVGGSKYGRARTAAFMGLKIITSASPAPALNGYLCRLDPATYREAYRPLLPPKMRGADFLDRYGDTDDPVTTVDPDQTYSVRACAEHPIYENARVTRFIELLGQADGRGERAMIAAGKLMYGSHWSYGRLCALGAPETDLLVRLVRERGPARGLYGAKITGGGSGGTVAVLARKGCDEAIGEIVTAYEARTGLRPDVFRGTSPGAYAWGCEHVTIQRCDAT